MGNKEDWEEIEKWAENEKLKKQDTFKMNLDKINLEKNTKRINIVAMSLGLLLKSFKALIFLIIAGIVFLVFMYAKNTFSKVSINDPETLYNTKIKVVSKSIDENGNEICDIVLKKKKDLHFQAINDGKMDDFEDNLQKYIFNSWNSETKKQFETEEEKNQYGLLTYFNYLNANTKEELEEKTEYIIEFIEYAEKWNKEYKIFKFDGQEEGKFIVPVMNIYIQIAERKIYPYSHRYTTPEELKAEVMKQYESINPK